MSHRKFPKSVWFTICIHLVQGKQIKKESWKLTTRLAVAFCTNKWTLFGYSLLTPTEKTSVWRLARLMRENLEMKTKQSSYTARLHHLKFRHGAAHSMTPVILYYYRVLKKKSQKMHYLLAVMHIIDIIRDGCRGWSDSTCCCNTHANSCNHERGAKGKRRQSQPSDGCHTTHSCGGAPRDASDLGLLVNRADVFGNGVEHDDRLPEDLSPLCEDLVKDTQATIDLIRQDSEGPVI